uniref:DUF4440 domain-containing protein n=1 Tax=Bursaphelenchus xylophilus TaxID=6326 RepID=A0A1I7RZD1_BURXY
MVLSREEIEKRVAPVEKLMEDATEKREYDRIATAYSENAVLIHLGVSVAKGRKEIAKAFEAFGGLDLTQVKTDKEFAFDVNDGEYLMRKGKFSIAGGPWFKFMQLFERQPDGSYLVIHDEFEFQ